MGDSSTTRRTTPVQMAAVTGAAQVAAGSRHSLVLKTDGTVWAAGLNTSGQIGDNTNTQRPTPVAVMTLSGVTAIAAGGASSYARTASGALWAWGANADGQLGDTTTTNRKVATTLASPADVSLMGAGSAHAIAVTSTGVVWTWGNNGGGRLGDGTTRARSTPGAISDVDYGWKVGTPVLSLGTGTYTVEKTVVVTCATTGADIHYTLNGDAPLESDPVIQESVSLRSSAWRQLTSLTNG